MSMGVYINCMEMPTKENAVILITPSGDVWMIGDMPNEDTHLVKAKAVTVPPHGRLIDADALCASHKEVCSRSMKFNLDLAPTVIPASDEG